MNEERILKLIHETAAAGDTLLKAADEAWTGQRMEQAISGFAVKMHELTSEALFEELQREEPLGPVSETIIGIDLSTATEVCAATNKVAERDDLRGSTETVVPKGAREDVGQEAHKEALKAGTIIGAAQLINNELVRDGKQTYRTGIEERSGRPFNEAVAAEIRKAMIRALSSDGLSVFVTGGLSDGFTIDGPYPGTVTAYWLHNEDADGEGIEITTPPFQALHNQLMSADNLPDVTENEFGWVVVFGGFGEPVQIEGIWVDQKDAYARAHDLTGRAVPLFGPIQFTNA